MDWKLLTKKREATQGLPPGKEDFAWVTNTVTLVYGQRDAILVDWLVATGKNLTSVYVNHTHGDHFFGLKLVLDIFPNARAYATVSGVAGMRNQIDPDFVRSFLEPRFPSQVPSHLVTPQILEGDALYLEREELRVIELGHTDTADSTALHVPSLGLVISGDAVQHSSLSCRVR